MNDEFDGTTLPLARIELDHGLELAECVDSSGARSLWVLSPDLDADQGDAGPLTAPHEQDGPLPREWRQRIGLVCGAVARTGKPCKTLVKSYGERCTHHHDFEELSEAELAGRLF